MTNLEIFEDCAAGNERDDLCGSEMGLQKFVRGFTNISIFLLSEAVIQLRANHKTSAEVHFYYDGTIRNTFDKRTTLFLACESPISVSVVLF